MIKELFEDMPIFTSIIALIVLGIVFILIDEIGAKAEPFNGTIVDKQYKAERSTTGVGTVTSSSGQVGTVVTSQTDPEAFLIMVKTGNGKIVTVECTAELYYQKEIGQEINCNYYRGLITGYVWSSKGVN